MNSLASASHYFFVYPWQLMLFSASCKFIFARNPLFWLVETDFLASGNHFPVNTRHRFNVDTTLYNIVRRCIDVETTSCIYWVCSNSSNILSTGSSFFHLVEIYLQRILHYSQWQQIFCLMRTTFFHSYFL